MLLDPATGDWQSIAIPTADGTTLGRPLAVADRFIAPRLRLTGSDPEPHGILTFDPDGAWPIASGPDGQLATPPGWTVADRNLTPQLTSPVELVTASTAPMPVGGDSCRQVPEAAMEALGPGDALVSIQRGGGEASSETAGALGNIRALEQAWTETSFVDCAANADELVAFWTQVTWSGLPHHLLVVHHIDTPASVIEEAVAVANSFRSP